MRASLHWRVMQLSADEQQKIVKAFDNPDEAQANGVRLAGQKFFTLSANARSVYGKKAVRHVPQASLSPSHHTSDLGPPTTQGDGCVLVKTKQAVLVAEYSAPVQAGEATPVVENLADYLIGVGY